MNEERRKKLEAARKHRRKKRSRRADAAGIGGAPGFGGMVQLTTMNIQREMNHIVERALASQATCVTLGPLVFFSTETRDAWMLDAEDGFALCLALGGDPEPVKILETETQTGVPWNREFSIDEEVFITSDHRGRQESFHGYPIRSIIQALERALYLRH